MATLECLKLALQQTVTPASVMTQPLSEEQYRDGFSVFLRDGQHVYRDFVTPQLAQLLEKVLKTRVQISMLEIGPGPASVVGRLPDRLRRRIGHYTAYEPNRLFATELETWLSSSFSNGESHDPPLPDLASPPDIRRRVFSLDNEDNQKTCFDVVLFCHSMYGMRPKRKYMEQALGLLSSHPGSFVVVFHREGVLQLDGLVSQRTATFPAATVCVSDDNNKALDNFAQFLAGCTVQGTTTEGDVDVRTAWRQVCRRLGKHGEELDGKRTLTFSAPEVMLTFTQHATALPMLTAQVPLAEERPIKNRQARLRRPAAVVRPESLPQVQQCVQWALKHQTKLTVVGGSHSGQCLWGDVVAVDMSAFREIDVLPDNGLVVAGAGCTSGEIVRRTMAAGLTVPLGARPSVGAGLWLQGGIGHLSRSHGLACDTVVGAVVVSVASGQVLCLGDMPKAHWPVGAIRPDNEAEWLWALRGAGTNIGIVVSATFRACAAPTYTTHQWVQPLRDGDKARQTLHRFQTQVASLLPRHCTADAYLYADNGQLQLGVGLFETVADGISADLWTNMHDLLGPEQHSETNVDGVGVFESEMYMGAMHGGHAGGKTSAFKRCVFLKDIGRSHVVDRLVAAVNARPSPFCYIHLLHGGQASAIGDVAADATAFGCRDWDFAAVVTGVWPRSQDGSVMARAAVQWVYDVVGHELLPVGCGVYPADLGRDPRDAPLAMQAFGPNGPRLALLKQIADPQGVLAYACPLSTLPKPNPGPGLLVILVTGANGAGKDYSAAVWASVLPRASVVSISDTTKEAYAAATGADLTRLLHDRDYKEQHRPALTAFFEDLVRQNPRLPEEHFLDVVRSSSSSSTNEEVDVLLVTGLRDKAPIATLSPLVPDCRLVEVQVVGRDEKDHDGRDWRPCLIFDNSEDGPDLAVRFAQHHLRPLIHPDLIRLASLPYIVPDVPHPGIDFVHVLHIAQQPDGLALCARLLQNRLLSVIGQTAMTAAIVTCEAGGFVFAAALSACYSLPLTLVRRAGKLPPPTVSVAQSPSHISATASGEPLGHFEMSLHALSAGHPIVIVDDVLSTGETLCAVLQLLRAADVIDDDGSNVCALAIAEFPVHCGRQRLRQRGFGRVRVQSLVVYDGA